MGDPKTELGMGERRKEIKEIKRTLSEDRYQEGGRTEAVGKGRVLCACRAGLGLWFLLPAFLLQ